MKAMAQRLLQAGCGRFPRIVTRCWRFRDWRVSTRNHPYFGPPTNYMTSPFFGQTTSRCSEPRSAPAARPATSTRYTRSAVPARPNWPGKSSFETRQRLPLSSDAERIGMALAVVEANSFISEDLARATEMQRNG